MPNPPMRSARSSASTERLLLAVPVVCAFCALFGVARTLATPPSPAPIETDRLRALAPTTNKLLNLRASEVVTLTIERAADGTLTTSARIGGKLQTMRLRPHSVRSPKFELTVQRGDGSYENVEPGAIRTYRGTLDGNEDSVVAASVLEDGLHAMIIDQRGERHWLEPLFGRVAGAGKDHYVVYRDDDVIAPNAACGVTTSVQGEDVLQPALGRPVLSLSVREPGALFESPGGVLFAELAIDMDFEFFEIFGDVLDTQTFVESVINTINVQYERDVGITHSIVKTIIRTTADDPYTSLDPSRTLDQFRDEWDRFHRSVQRDVAHMFVGRNLRNANGIAFITGICDGLQGYSVAETFACNSFACKTDLSAHELGHNWGGFHCSCPGWTMNFAAVGANQFHPDLTIPGIVFYRDTRTCLDDTDEFIGFFVTPPQPTITEGVGIQFIGKADYRFVDVDVSADATWTVEPPSIGTMDKGFFVPDDVDGPADGMVFASAMIEGIEHFDEASFTVVQAEPGPQSDVESPEKVRYISMVIPADQSDRAVRVELTSIHHPLPDNAGTIPAPDLTMHEGELRWVGPVGNCVDTEIPLLEYRCAQLQCEPHYADDWGTEPINVTGAAIIPSSLYTVRTVPRVCRGNEPQCGLASAPLLIRTQRWGDILTPFQLPEGPPGTASQPDVRDLTAMVDRVAEAGRFVSFPTAKLNGNAPDPATKINVTDLTYAVDTVKSAAYPFPGPCTCPPIILCPETDKCGRCVPR